MADTSYLSQQGALDLAILTQTQMAECTMHLFNYASLPAPTPLTTLAQFQAAECNFDGYAAKTIATWSAPVLAGAAYAIYAPTQTFTWVYSAGTMNMVGGYWIALASGDLKSFVIFNPAESAAGPYQAIIRTPTIVVPWG